jgi:sugar/nucleoside kinase (ribokinase family)
VVGAITRDLDLAANGGDGFRPGGVVLHGGLALARLGATTRIVTRVHREDEGALFAALRQAGVATLALPSRETTTYANDYSGVRTRHELRAMSDPIGPADVPVDWREADVVQLGPLHPGDILPETAALFRGYRGIDVQGLVRVPGPRGTRLEPCAALPQFVEHVDVVQASESELPAVLDGATLERFVARHGVREMIVTRGARGATVVTRRGAHDVPAVATPVRAPVGAGDVFLAAYLLLRVRGRGPVDAARGAAQVAAEKIAGTE